VNVNELPEAQALSVKHIALSYQLAGVPFIIHLNRCGCCVSVHEQAEHPVGGYVIGPDGGFDWHDLAHDSDS